MGSTIVKFFRGLSGAVTAGVIVLTLVVIGAAFVGNDRSFPGPGGVSIAWHIAVSVVALMGQRLADHRNGAIAVAGSAIVLAAAGLLLWTQWWE